MKVLYHGTIVIYSTISAESMHTTSKYDWYFVNFIHIIIKRMHISTDTHTHTYAHRHTNQNFTW